MYTRNHRILSRSTLEAKKRSNNEKVEHGSSVDTKEEKYRERKGDTRENAKVW